MHMHMPQVSSFHAANDSLSLRWALHTYRVRMPCLIVCPVPQLHVFETDHQFKFIEG